MNNLGNFLGSFHTVLHPNKMMVIYRKECVTNGRYYQAVSLFSQRTSAAVSSCSFSFLMPNILLRTKPQNFGLSITTNFMSKTPFKLSCRLLRHVVLSKPFLQGSEQGRKRPLSDIF